jgi:cyclophilin family peptidyl-prolyl cis-trans isomerase
VNRCIALTVTLLAFLLITQAHAACNLSGLAQGTQVAEVETPVGTLCIELLTADAPLHVANFLYYLNNGLMVDTFFHRSIPGFILQGGGFTVGASDYEAVAALNGTVTNEACTLDIPDPLNPGGQICSVRGNERGTVALAKVGGDPDSGSTNWFINLADNRSNLDNQNGGFTVFGRLVDGSIAVADAMAALSTANANDIFWKQTAYTGFTIPLLAPPLATSFGCWDPTLQATALSAAALPSLLAWSDPVLPGMLMTLSAACGTAILPAPTTEADLPVDSCATPGGFVVRTSGPVSPQVTGGFFSLTCAEVQESLNQRALWLTAYQAHFDQQLVLISSATLYVKSAVPSMTPVGVVLLSCLIIGGGLRALRS